MLKFIRGGQRWLTALFVVGVGGVFVFFLGLGGPLSGGGAGGSVVEVGHYQFGLREFERVRESRARFYQEQLGEEFDARALADTLDTLAARELVEQALLAIEAEQLGLTVGRQEIEQFVLASPSFRDESGRFDKELFERYAEYEFGNQRNFMRDQELSLLARKMLRVLSANSRVSAGEAREAVRNELEEVRIAFTVLDAAEAPDDVEISPEEIARALEERGPEIEALYAELGERYNAPERVRARHILLNLEKDAAEHQEAFVRSVAETALDRVKGGEDFAKVAAELSQDPGSRERGGDLGFFARGQMIKAFEDVAFSLEPGQVSDIVRTDFGLHVIKVEEHKQALNRPLDEVREEVAEELLRSEAGRAEAQEMAERLAAAIREGQSLVEATRNEELTSERSGWLTRRPDGFVPGLGAAQELLATAFALEPGQSSPRLFEVGDKIALVQLLERSEPEPEEVEPRVSEKREELVLARRSARADTWLRRRRAALLEEGRLHVDLDPLGR